MLRVHIAALAIADGSASAGEAVADVISEQATGAGHDVVARAVVGNNEAAIRAQLAAWIADPNIDVAVAFAAEANHAVAVLASLGRSRALADAKQAADVQLFHCDKTFVFVLPGAVDAASEAMDTVVLPQLETSRSLVAEMPRLAASSARSDVRRSGTRPPRPPADKRASAPPPVVAGENLVNTSEIVAIADAPPPPSASAEKRTSKPPPLPAGQNQVTTSEIVAIADAPPPPPRRTQPPPLPRPGSDEHLAAGAVLLMPRRNSVGFGRWIAIALLAGASGFGLTAWMLRANRAPSTKPAVSELPHRVIPTAVEIVELDAGIPEVVVEVSGTVDRADPSRKPVDNPATTTHSSGSGVASGSSSPPERSVSTSPTQSASRAADDDCPEETCILERSARPCCSRYKSGTAAPAPQALERWMVKAGVEQVKPRVVACGEKTAAKGTVRVAVKVEPDGSVSEAVIAESPTAELGECVEAALRSGKFTKTTTGGAFRYPFVF